MAEGVRSSHLPASPASEGALTMRTQNPPAVERARDQTPGPSEEAKSAPSCALKAPSDHRSRREKSGKKLGKTEKKRSSAPPNQGACLNAVRAASTETPLVTLQVAPAALCGRFKLLRPKSGRESGTCHI